MRRRVPSTLQIDRTPIAINADDVDDEKMGEVPGDGNRHIRRRMSFS